MSKLSRLGRVIGATKKFTGALTGSTARAEAARQAEKAAKAAKRAAKLKKKNKRLKKQANQSYSPKELRQQKRDQEIANAALEPKKTKKPKKDKKLKDVVDEQAGEKEKFQFEKTKGKAVKTKNLDEFAASETWAGNGLKPRGDNVWDKPKKLKKFLKQNPQHEGKSEFAQRQEYFKEEMRRIFNQPGRPWHKHPDVRRMRAFGRIGQRYQSQRISPTAQKKNYLP
tara:strand:- start:479 stop:1156 length:678 start_codon:yes stop_codon:yes gene_type:complete